MGNLALEFAFKYVDTHSYGYCKNDALKATAESFKRSITAIAIRKNENKEVHRRYYFNDDTSLVFRNDEFQLCRRKAY